MNAPAIVWGGRGGDRRPYRKRGAFIPLYTHTHTLVPSYPCVHTQFVWWGGLEVEAWERNEKAEAEVRWSENLIVGWSGKVSRLRVENWNRMGWTEWMLSKEICGIYCSSGSVHEYCGVHTVVKCNELRILYNLFLKTTFQLDVIWKYDEDKVTRVPECQHERLSKWECGEESPLICLSLATLLLVPCQHPCHSKWRMIFLLTVLENT